MKSVTSIISDDRKIRSSSEESSLIATARIAAASSVGRGNPCGRSEIGPDVRGRTCERNDVGRITPDSTFVETLSFYTLFE